MTLDTDLSRKPYFDDYDDEKNFYRVLYRPGVAVQTRELNQMQSILQDQIDKFGRSIYREGSVIEGCAFTFDNNYRYAKIEDTYANGAAITSLSDFEQKYAINSNGLKALIIDTETGFEINDPNLNTLYFKYLNSGTYPNGAVQSSFLASEQLRIHTSANVTVGNVNITSVTNAVGVGYAMTVTEGIIFKKGFFLRVNPQTVVVDKYSNIPDNISVGFNADEVLVTPEMDTTLLDNAAGSPNEDAPGAHRLRVVPTLTTRVTSQTGNTSNFFSLVDFKNGLPVTIKTDPQYVSLNKELARRTYETNGDYVVKPFLLSTSNKAANDAKYSTHLNLVSSQGIGYVKGYRVEFVNNNTADLRKGTDYASLADQSVSLNFGYYININEYSGDFGNHTISQIELHSVPKKSLTNRTFLSTGISSTTRIGTAYCRGVAYSSGSPGSPDASYRLYIFNVSMLPGKSFSQVRSIYSSTGLKAFADVILQLDGSGVSIAAIQDPTNELMLHKFGQKAIKANGFGSTSKFVYRKRANSSFDGAGSMTVTLPSVGGSATEQMYYTGSLSSSNESKLLVLPLSEAYSTNNSGNVTVYTSNGYVLGTSTSFLTEYNVGDYFAVNTGTTIEKRRITSIGSNLVLNVDSPFIAANTSARHQKYFPPGVPLNFAASSTRTMTANTTAVTLQLGTGDTPNNSSMQCSAYYDVLRASTYPTAKVIRRNTWIKIDTSNNVGGTTGPWCLGIPDVLKVNAVHVGVTYNDTWPNKVSQFILDNGQRDSYYGLASLKATTAVPAGSKLLVSVDNFTYDRTQGRGFFTAASYPIDDANTANTAAIQTTQIPVYVSTATQTTTDLRDVVDIRPYAANTANATTLTYAAATINPSSTLSLVVDATHGGYIPTPDTPFQADIQYYLPRKDRIALTTGGDILVIEGAAEVNPMEPPEIPGTMTIGIADIPAYPSLTPSDARTSNRFDHSVKTTIKQTERYTMADIGKFSNRISRLEYYTSLNLLEQSTASLQVRSDVTGKNRFQNGILVDPFQDHTIGNTQNPEYSIAIDSTRGEARPRFNQIQIPMYFDAAASTNVQQTGEIVTLPYTSVEVLTQPYASKIRNCIEGNIYNYTGVLSLSPPGLVDSDITTPPDVVTNIDINQNWVNLRDAWGTQWANWVDETPSTSQQYRGLLGGGTGSDPAGYRQQVVTLTTQEQQKIKFDVSNNQTVSLSGANISTSLQPLVKQINVGCVLNGMKPNTKLYCYINDYNMSAFASPYDGANWGTYGSDLITDASGHLIVNVYIPANIFQSGILEFKFVDVPNLTQGESAITTKATKDFIASSLYINRDRVNILNSTINKANLENANRIIQQITDVREGAPLMSVNPPPPVTEGGVDAGGGSFGGGGTPSAGGSTGDSIGFGG